MKIIFPVLMLVAVIGTIPLNARAETTYAERLGWPAGTKVAIFHADDAGMSHWSNAGIITAFEQGLLTSTSTMMPCPWVPEFAHYLEKHPDTDNGLHLTFTSEWTNYRWTPLAGQAAVPGLTDKEGCLWDNVPLVVQHASPDEFETELRAQIARARRMGIPITHLDTHMGTVFATPEFFARYVKVGIEEHIPIMLPGGHLQYASQNDAEAVKKLRGSGMVEKVWNAGLPVIDDVLTTIYDWKTYPEKKKNFIAALRNQKPGITQYILHCTEPNEAFSYISSSGSTRAGDLKLMLDPDVKKVVQEEHIVLTTWRELARRRAAMNSATLNNQK